MPVIDVRFTKLEAVRAEKVKASKDQKGVSVESNSKMNEILKKEVPGLGEAVIVNFEYNTTYTPEIGNIKIEGRCVYSSKNLENEITEEKKKKIKLMPEVFEEIQNVILASASIQALLLAKELKLPSPVQLPRVKIGEE
jgi:hypothetical protein